MTTFGNTTSPITALWWSGSGRRYRQPPPHLETLKLSYINIWTKDIQVIGHNCHQLKSFKMKTYFRECHGDAHAIAYSMSALRHLKLGCSTK
ncbi:hypothetical protein OSB04_002017 [Centaurea solstitialis]|uniref:Uncharacterized protein n=1 Tax=Centaurea solstitialis TaxID=347529 RepID=A0AA38U2N7_9ASTR|nr:hypothetical protein OSB04_002017 [Centaurea solstitialis]